MYVLRFATLAALCVLCFRASLAQSYSPQTGPQLNGPHLTGGQLNGPLPNSPQLNGPSVELMQQAPSLAHPSPKPRTFLLGGRSEQAWALSRDADQLSVSILPTPKNLGSPLAEKAATCFTMRSYLFSHEDAEQNAPRVTGYTTCTASTQLRARDAVGGLLK